MPNYIEVEQGNGKGISITHGTNEILFTNDLIGCIAVLIIGKEKCYMIHSDASNNSGIGGVTLRKGIENLTTQTQEQYKIVLVGGSSEESRSFYAKTIKNILPNANISSQETNSGSVYLTSDGVIASTKKELRGKLNIDTSITTTENSL